jgi:hypothetical protein
LNSSGKFIAVQHARAISILLCKESSETDQTTSAFLEHLCSEFIDQDLLKLRNCLWSLNHDTGLVSWLIPLLELVETLYLTLIFLEDLTLGWHAAVHGNMRGNAHGNVHGNKYRHGNMNGNLHGHVGVHGSEIVDGIEQRLAFAGRGRRNIQINNVGRQSFGRDLESGTCAR